MKFLILVSIFFVGLFANDDIFSIYRQKGIKEVERVLSARLEDRVYWKSYLETLDTRFGFYENLNFLLFCNKSLKKFYFYEYKESKFTELSSVDAYIGLLGDKEKQGDLKTPIGVYELVSKKSNVDEFYGPLALITSYPNTLDTLNGKDGYGIWIHGLPLKSERPDNTKGCIALENSYLSGLADKIDITKTLLVTTEDNFLFKPSNDEMATVLSSLYSWKRAWERGDLKSYLSFYSNEFKRFDGMKFDEFRDYKTRVFAKDEPKTIDISNVNITPYPNKELKRIYRVSFYEDYKAPSYKFQGYKELFVTSDGDKFSILVEK